MKKLFYGLICICTFILVIFLTMNSIDKYYSDKINGRYYDAIGNSLRLEKNQGLMLQNMSIIREDNMQIFGSSELSGVAIPTHPNNFFHNKKDGFQIDMIGRGYSESLVHAMNFEALNGELKDKKVAIILSPQWFTPKGLTPAGLNMNFSELQFYSIMFNKNINKNSKMYIANRLNSLLNETMDFAQIRVFSYLYSKDNIGSKILLGGLMPYYKFKYYVLNIKDKKNTLKVIEEYKGQEQFIKPQTTKFDWEEELNKAEKIAEKDTTNNTYGIQNDYFDTYIKSRYESLKNSSVNESFKESLEYDDLKFLLDVCKSQGIKPLFIIVPVHGEWYDYTGFKKENRDAYYKKATKLIGSYGFKYEDLSKYEYEEYFLKDIMHLGWKGWLYVDKAIDRYYHED